MNAPAGWRTTDWKAACTTKSATWMNWLLSESWSHASSTIRRLEGKAAVHLGLQPIVAVHGHQPALVAGGQPVLQVVEQGSGDAVAVLAADMVHGVHAQLGVGGDDIEGLAVHPPAQTLVMTDRSPRVSVVGPTPSRDESAGV